MTIDLDRLEELAKSATPGPWVAEVDDWNCSVILDDDQPGTAYIAERLTQGKSEGEADAEFIAALDPTTILALITEVRRLRETVGLLHGWEDRAKKAEAERDGWASRMVEFVDAQRALARVAALADSVENRMMATAKPSEIRAALAGGE
jgi:hypothetical protein